MGLHEWVSPIGRAYDNERALLYRSNPHLISNHEIGFAPGCVIQAAGICWLHLQLFRFDHVVYGKEAEPCLTISFYLGGDNHDITQTELELPS